MSNAKVKLCRDCRHQMPTPGAEWNSQCLHPSVNAKNAYALANTGGNGFSASSSAKDERERGWWSPCGMRGALWEPKQGASK
jgi:hypothetical protein